MLRTHHHQNHVFTILDDSQPVFSYRYGAVDFHPYGHPLLMDDGRAMTMEQPGDHPWHNGMFFAWKYINNHNVWDQQTYHDHPTGKCRDLGVQLTALTPDAATLLNQLEWIDSTNQAMMLEQRKISVALDRATGARIVDWDIKSTALMDEVLLEREVQWGGYGGFMIRLPRMIKPLIMNDCGESNWPESHKPRCNWVDFTWNTDGLPSRTWHEHFAGVTLMSHPQNPRSPLSFHIYHESHVCGIHPALLQDGTLLLKNSETIAQRYRLFFHKGKITPEAIGKTYSDWTKR